LDIPLSMSMSAHSSPVKRGIDDNAEASASASPTKKPMRILIEKPFIKLTIDWSETDLSVSDQIKTAILKLSWGEHPSPITCRTDSETGPIVTFDIGEWLNESLNKERISKFLFHDGGPLKQGDTIWNLATIPYEYLMKGQGFTQTAQYVKVINDGAIASRFFLPALVTNSSLATPGKRISTFQLNAQPPEHLWDRAISNICYAGALGKRVVVNSFRQGVNFSTRSQDSTSTTDFPVRRANAITAYNGSEQAFVLGRHQTLPLLDRDLTEADFVLVIFTVGWYVWKRPQTDRVALRQSLTDTSPQKKAAEGYQTAISFNIQDVILLEAGSDHGAPQLEEYSDDEEEGELI